MKTAFALIIALALAGCTANIRMTDIAFDAGRDMKVDAAGAQNTTGTEQLATADLSTLVDAAKSALAGKTSSIIDKIKDVITDDEVDTGAAVSPAAGEIVEVD